MLDCKSDVTEEVYICHQIIQFHLIFKHDNLSQLFMAGKFLTTIISNIPLDNRVRASRREAYWLV